MDDGSRDEARRRERRRAREPLDYSPSSGAVNPDHAAQDANTEVRVGRHAYGENATFTVTDIPESDVRWADDDPDDESRHWSTLNELNRRFHASDDRHIGTEQKKVDYVNDTMAWGERIGLTDYERKRAARLALDADDGWKNNHGMEPLILAALTLTANENGPRREDETKAIRESVPTADENPRMVDAYERLRRDLGVSKRAVRSCREHLRQFR